MFCHSIGFFSEIKDFPNQQSDRSQYSDESFYCVYLMIKTKTQYEKFELSLKNYDNNEKIIDINKEMIEFFSDQEIVYETDETDLFMKQI